MIKYHGSSFGIEDLSNKQYETESLDNQDTCEVSSSQLTVPLSGMKV